MSRSQIKVTLKGRGGPLDCRIIDVEDGVDVFDQNGPVNDAVKDIALNCVFSDGDTITIEEVYGQ